CEGFAINLKNTSTFSGAGTVTQEWSFGDVNNTTSTNKDESFIYPTQGTYSVTLKSDVDGCFSEKTKLVYQFAKPVVDFTAPDYAAAVCNHSEVVFPNNSTISVGTAGAYWDYGNMTNSNNTNGKGMFDEVR